jgi:hypothetical protein
MRHNHDDFHPEVLERKKAWVPPTFSCVQLSADELEEAGTSRESIAAFGLKLKAQRRL